MASRPPSIVITPAFRAVATSITARASCWGSSRGWIASRFPASGRAAPPYTLNPYAPGFYWLIQAVTHPGSERRSLTAGRWVNFVLLLLTAALIAGYVIYRIRRVEAGLLSALLYLTALPVQWWSFYYRVDHLALFFALLACLAAPVPAYGPIAASLAIVLGSLVKQTVVTMAIPIGLFFFLRREYRHLGVFLGLVALLGAAAWGILNLHTHGFYIQSTRFANLRKFDFPGGFKLAAVNLLSPLPIVAFCVFIYLLLARRKRLLDSAVALAFAAELFVQVVLASKAGSACNYYLGPMILGAILIGEHGPALLKELTRGKRAAVAAGLLACGVIPAFWHAAPERA